MSSTVLVYEHRGPVTCVNGSQRSTLYFSFSLSLLALAGLTHAGPGKRVFYCVPEDRHRRMRHCLAPHCSVSVVI